MREEAKIDKLQYRDHYRRISFKIVAGRMDHVRVVLWNTRLARFTKLFEDIGSPVVGSMRNGYENAP